MLGSLTSNLRAAFVCCATAEPGVGWMGADYKSCHFPTEISFSQLEDDFLTSYLLKTSDIFGRLHYSTMTKWTRTLYLSLWNNEKV